MYRLRSSSCEPARVIIWINGAFGAGKTTVTRQLLQARPALATFDTEHVGDLLRGPLQERKPVPDFPGLDLVAPPCRRNPR